jgi:hypothetical protein
MQADDKIHIDPSGDSSRGVTGQEIYESHW